ncbi:MAG: nucleotidyltransferase family protein [Candidatus Diapherotrites archaeon]
MDIKKAFILAGGKGERLKPLTDNTPKVLIEVYGKSIIEHNLLMLKSYGIDEVVLGTGVMHNQIENALGKEKFGIKINYSREHSPQGTGGALRLAKRFFKETFIMINGDEMKEVDFSKMESIHSENTAICTIALTEIEDPSDFGVVVMDGDRIVQFVQKPSLEDAPSNLINAGAYILEPEIFRMMPWGQFSLEQEVFPKIAEMGKLYGCDCLRQWFPTDTYKRLERARLEWQELDSE